MRLVARALVGLLAAGTLTAVPAAGNAAGSSAPRPAWCTTGGTVSAAAIPAYYTAATCAAESLTIVDGAASVQLPPRGQSVSGSVLLVGGHADLTVERGADGSVRVIREVHRDAGPAGADVAASACSSSSYDRLGWRIVGSYGWLYNPSNAPRSVAGNAAGVLRAATTDITSGRDNCGIAGKPRTSHRYNGTTSRAPGVSQLATCTRHDGRNVSGWKALDSSNILAVTCTWYYSDGRVASSDAAINTRVGWTTSPQNCRNAFDLRGVMTHERGHTYGLGHSTADRGLTMYPSIAPCDFSKSTLGRGDLLGLFAIYGKA